MYNLVVVDDERIIRTGLSEYVDWNEMGFTLVAAFGDGRDTIEYLARNHADVVLTDIKMVKASGLEVAQYVHENHLPVITVIMSGHRDFEYARSAMEFGARHYLLKPIDNDEMRSVFASIRGELDHRREALDRRNRERHNLDDVIPIIRRQFVQDLLDGRYTDPTEFETILSLIGLSIDPERSRCLVIRLLPIGVDHSNNGDSGMTKIASISSAVEDEEKSLFVTKNGDQALAICRANQDPEWQLQRIQDHLDAVAERLNRTAGVRFEYEIAERYEHLNQLVYRARRRAQQDEPRESSHIGLGHYGAFFSVLENRDRDELHSAVHDLLLHMESMSLVFVQNTIVELFARIIYHYASLGIDLWNLPSGPFDYRDIHTLYSVPAVRDWTIRKLGELMEVIEHRERPQDTLHKALSYIEAHFDDDPSREEVANYVHVNPSYFSRLFRQKTGKTFTEYVTSIRIQKAVDLMGTGAHRIGEIGTLVGYKSANYFARVFKQETGYSPTEYVRKVLDKNPGSI